MKMAALLERADRGLAGAFHNADDATRRLIGPLELPPVTMQADDHLVAMHGDAGIFSSNIDVRPWLGSRRDVRGLLGPQEGEAVLIEFDGAHDEVGVLRQDETVGPDT